MTDATPGATEIEDLRRELERLRGAARDLALELDRAQRQSAQARALALEEADVEARMERLEAVLDLGPVTQYVRDAMSRAILSDRPSTHAVLVEGLLPPTVQRAAVEAIPAPIFRADPGQSAEIALPPKPAPTYVVATWLFLNDLARDVVAPALVERVAATSGQVPALRLKLSRSRLLPWHEDSWAALVPSQDAEGLALVVRLGDGYDWHLVFDWTDKPQSSRRRHGDITSWGPSG
jgi:hypothetical protein